MNKSMIIGRLGRDPETRYTPSGMPVTTLSVATNEVRKAQDGETVKDTEWHRVVLFEKLAEPAAKYLKKGNKVYIEGPKKTRKWQGQDGIDRYTPEILAREMEMLDGRNQQSDGAGVSAGHQHATPPDHDFDGAGPPDFGDDIPY